MRTVYSPIYTLKQYERGIVEFFGKYRRFVEPGLHFQLPFVELTRIRDIREHTMDFPPQDVITKDNVEITVDGIIWARPGLDSEDVKMSFYHIDDWSTAVLELAKTNLRQEFGKLTLDESLVAREKIASNLQLSLDKMTDNWGIKVCNVEIKLIDPPEDIKKAMHKQKIAEQERRAMRLLATGKFEAAEQEKKATIQVAEGRKEAEIRVAEGKAKAIELVNEAAEKYFAGNAQDLKKLEVTENCLKNNTKVVLTDKGITPQLVVGDLPVIEKQTHQNTDMK
ncbi:SPFH/Band 7/PHB domain protein [Desulfonema ishimotonii]|uniref:SPFH/Band 7/PHB domain protein n=1 Tax=Desulfonema ishimotonii TaxID=45657 RepID=A0A401FYP1_9BACT|nr:SPFH domain-containing protein [Desulfonema ishimotonii]GBC62063.1 SPFH/Band 7/PHB domain protein [Desulfonema ishimotonii]